MNYSLFGELSNDSDQVETRYIDCSDYFYDNVLYWRKKIIFWFVVKDENFQVSLGSFEHESLWRFASLRNDKFVFKFL